MSDTLVYHDDSEDELAYDKTNAELGVPSGVSATDSPIFVTVKLTGLTDGYIPYHVNDATGLADGPTKSNVDSAVSLKHTQGTDTTLGTMAANVAMGTHKLTGLSVPASNGDSVRATTKITEALLESATDLKHAAVTVSAPISLSGQAVSLVNNAVSPATITAIDVGALANSDTVIPTSKAVQTAIGGAGGGNVYGSASVTDGHMAVFDTDGYHIKDGGAPGGGSAHVIQDETTPLTARAALNFTGAGVTVTDNAGTGASDVTIPGGGAGSDLVQVATGAGSIVIPGLKGSPDAVPASPSAYDDEFNAFSGWTTLGALDVLNVTDCPSHVHMKKNTSGSQIDGIYKACPTPPFTVTTKFSDYLNDVNYQYIGLMLLDATPTALFTFGYFAVGAGNSYIGYYPWTNRTTRGGGTEVANVFTRQYLRMVVTAGNNIGLYASFNGYVWSVVGTGKNSGLTPVYVGLLVSGNGGTVVMEATVDWIRFT